MKQNIDLKISLEAFNDSNELADKLREIAGELVPGKAYYLNEAAIHLKSLFSHFKALAETRTTTYGMLAHFSKALTNERLTYEAKGMLIYLYSLDDINYISMAKLIENSTSGRDKTRRIFKELVSKGFVNKYLDRDNKGRFSHDVFYLNERKIELNKSGETK